MVFSIFLEPFYAFHKKLNRIVRVQVLSYLWIGDKQDKAEVTNTTQGASNFHLRYGYSCDYFNSTKSPDTITACEECMEKLSNVYFKDFSDLGFDGSCKIFFCFSHEKLRTNPRIG